MAKRVSVKAEHDGAVETLESMLGVREATGRRSEILFATKGQMRSTEIVKGLVRAEAAKLDPVELIEATLDMMRDLPAMQDRMMSDIWNTVIDRLIKEKEERDAEMAEEETESFAF